MADRLAHREEREATVDRGNGSTALLARIRQSFFG